MPIRAEERARYPKNWKSEVVPRIRKRSKNRCECHGECGLTHTREDWGARCKARNGKPHPTTGSIVVLTVAHLNHTPEDNRDVNLRHMCQQCHLRYDAPLHRRNAEKTRRTKKGNLELFDG